MSEFENHEYQRKTKNQKKINNNRKKLKSRKEEKKKQQKGKAKKKKTKKDKQSTTQNSKLKTHFQEKPLLIQNEIQKHIGTRRIHRIGITTLLIQTVPQKHS